MNSRVTKLEDKLGDVREDYSAIKTNLVMITGAVQTLADIRAETLHIIKQQEQNLKDHDGIFKRMRETEKVTAENGILIEESRQDILGIKSNQRWAVTTLLVVIAGAVLGVIIRKYLNG